MHTVHAAACTLLREAYWRGMVLYVHAENTLCTIHPALGASSICDTGTVVAGRDIIKLGKGQLSMN